MDPYNWKMWLANLILNFLFFAPPPLVGCLEGPHLYSFVGELLLGEGHIGEAILPHGASAASP